MKVIRQIVGYFESRGVLSAEQIEYLKKQGFYGPTGIEEDEEDDLSARWDRRDDEDEDWDGDDLVHPKEWARLVKEDMAGRKRPQGTRPKGRVMKAPELCERLAGQIQGWEADLAGLLQLARRIFPVDSWEQAAVVIHNTEQDALCRNLADGLASRHPSLKALWNFLSVEDYRSVVGEPGLKGPAVRAYRAILASGGRRDLGQHGWLLRKKEVRWVTT